MVRFNLFHFSRETWYGKMLIGFTSAGRLGMVNLFHFGRSYWNNSIVAEARIAVASLVPLGSRSRCRTNTKKL